VVKPEQRQRLSGNWDALPPNVAQYGRSADEIFAGYYEVEKKVGSDEMKHIPYGAIAMFTLADKLAARLQQLLAGARKFNINEITRNELFSGNRETEAVTGIPFLTDVMDDSAKQILKG